MLQKYFKIWVMMARNSFITWISKWPNFIVFVSGKMVRYIFYFVFLYFLMKNTNGLAEYTGNQVLFFVATYTLIDTIAQFLFRSVYTFRSMVISGDFDLILIRPINPLFRVLVGGPDPMDFITIPPIIFVVYYIGSMLSPLPLGVLYYILLVLNGLLISMAFHIAVLSLGIITLEVDHMIMIYRDLVSMGRLPIDIYKEPLRGILTFLIPVGIMISLPVKALMGLINPPVVFGSFALGVLLLFLSLKFWNYALRFYTSASS